MVVTASTKDRDHLVDMDQMVLRESGSVMIVYDMSAEHARLKAIDPFLLGLSTRPIQ